MWLIFFIAFQFNNTKSIPADNSKKKDWQFYYYHSVQRNKKLEFVHIQSALVDGDIFTEIEYTG